MAEVSPRQETQPRQETEAQIAPTQLSGLLYISHTLSTWNTRLFQFGSTLFMAAMFPGTLFPVSVYALCSALPGALLSKLIGRYIDNTNRLQVGRSSIVGQRLAVIAACLLFLFPPVRDYRILVAFAILGGVENASSIINTVAVERDWVVVVAGSDKTFLRNLNARMRFIDLLCKLLGPLFIGMVDAYHQRLAVYTTLGLSVASISIEYFTLARVYYAMPALAEPRRRPQTENGEDAQQPKTTYWRHPMLLPSLSLTLLYMTVLSFSGQMVAFLLATGMTPDIITYFRTASVIVELSTTFIAPKVMNQLGTLSTGVCFIDFQALVLAITTGVFFKVSHQLSGVVLCIGVALSRLGLWGFDLSAQILVQEGVGEHERGSFSATEKALQNTCSILVYVSTMIFSKPLQFKWPALISSGAVCAAALLFSYFAFQQSKQGHISL